MKSLISIYIVLMLIAQSAAYAEPRCSRFHYEEKLLEKMIRMEIEMEKLKLDMVTTIRPNIEKLNKLSAIQPVPMIAFSAYNPAHSAYGYGPIIVFKSVLLNEGSSYDASTGIFTAKVKGLYQFTAHICNKEKLHAVVAIVHNGNKIAISTQYEGASSSCGSVSSLIKVGAGEQVNVISAYSSTNILEDSYRRASFMGFLVHE